MTGWSAVGSHVGRAWGIVRPQCPGGNQAPRHSPGSEGARSSARGVSRAMGSMSVARF